MRVKLVLSYIGTAYYGWQRQPSKPTIQQELEEAFFKIAGQRVSLTASGRTDEGVHAIAQVAHFDFEGAKSSCDTDCVCHFVASRDASSSSTLLHATCCPSDTAFCSLKPAEKITKNVQIEKLAGAFNFYLPSDIRVTNIEAVSDDFNANKSPKSKTYIYDMYIGEQNALLENRALFIPLRGRGGRRSLTGWGDNILDFSAMQKAAKEFIGTHDFIGFRAKGSSSITTVRTITNCKLEKVDLYGSSGYRLKITANGFLYKMVRIIVGTLLKVGNGKMTAADIKTILKQAKEWDKKTPAPPHGLYLLSVEY